MNIDEKQWIVSRLDTLHKTTYDELQLSREDFSNIREEEKASIKSVLKTYLSTCTVIITILVGLYASDLSHTVLLQSSKSPSLTYGNLFWTLLLGVVILAISIFAVASYVMKKTNIVFNNIGNSIVEAQANLNHNYGFLIRNTIWLENVSKEKLENYQDFMLLLSVLVSIPIREALIEGTKFKMLDQYYKSFFVEHAKEFERLIDKALPSFDKIDKNNLPQELLKTVMDTISSYKK